MLNRKCMDLKDLFKTQFTIPRNLMERKRPFCVAVLEGERVKFTGVVVQFRYFTRQGTIRNNNNQVHWDLNITFISLICEAEEQLRTTSCEFPSPTTAAGIPANARSFSRMRENLGDLFFRFAAMCIEPNTSFDC